jgi:hypothetical protein
VIAGLLLAVGCALAGSVSVLLKQRGAVAAPTVGHSLKIPGYSLRRRVGSSDSIGSAAVGTAGRATRKGIG